MSKSEGLKRSKVSLRSMIVGDERGTGDRQLRIIERRDGQIALRLWDGTQTRSVELNLDRDDVDALIDGLNELLPPGTRLDDGDETDD